MADLCCPLTLPSPQGEGIRQSPAGKFGGHELRRPRSVIRSSFSPSCCPQWRRLLEPKRSFNSTTRRRAFLPLLGLRAEALAKAWERAG